MTGGQKLALERSVGSLMDPRNGALPQPGPACSQAVLLRFGTSRGGVQRGEIGSFNEGCHFKLQKSACSTLQGKATFHENQATCLEVRQRD